MHIDALHLSPGSYTLGLWVARGRGDRAWSVFDSVSDAARMDVESFDGAPSIGTGLVPCTATVERL